MVPLKKIISFDSAVLYLVYGIIVSVPLIFGARHPIVSGTYTFLILVVLGGWLLFSAFPEMNIQISFWSLVPILLILYVGIQSVPLPLAWVEWLSPLRAHRIMMVNTLADTHLMRVSLSDQGIAGLYSALSIFSLILYFYSLRKLLESNDTALRTILYCIVGVGIFEAVYGLLQFVSPHLGILWLPITSRAAYGTIIYKNQYASLLNMIWPLCITCGSLYFIGQKKAPKKRKKRKWLLALIDEFSAVKAQGPLLLFSSGLMILAVIFSLSRGGILAMLLVALLLVMLLPFSRKKKLIFIALFLLCIVGYAALLGLNTVVNRFDSVEVAGTLRMDIYRYSLPMLWDHWLTGIGMGSYTLLSPVYLKGFPPGILFDRAHNEYLEIMIELGLPMALLFFVWVSVGMYRLLKRLLSATSHLKDERDGIAIGIAAFCGLAGFLAHGIVDFGWRLPANQIYAVTLLAIGLTCLKSKGKISIHQNS